MHASDFEWDLNSANFDSLKSPRVLCVSNSSSLLGLSEPDPLLEKRYVHYIQSPTRGQEPLNDHLADGCGLKTELFRFPEMIRIRVQSP